MKGPAPKGIHINSNYLLVYLPSHPGAMSAKKLYYPLHRLVMEWKLGRRLERSEVVHHIDGDPLNNHPDNLELLSPVEHNKHTASERVRDRKGLFVTPKMV